MRKRSLTLLASLVLGAALIAPAQAQQTTTPTPAPTPSPAPTPAPNPKPMPAPAPAHNMDPDHNVQGGALPAGWSGRTDRGQPINLAKFEPMGTGFHVTTGPAAIFYRGEADKVAVGAPFHTLATFTQTKAPAHPEAYGMFVAGNSLDADGQSYIYVLVRGDGSYMIKKRVGTTVTSLVEWTASPAVVKADSAGKATNKIEVAGQGGKIKFTINGTDVYTMNATAAEAAGVIGLRVNHNLDVHVEGFAVHRIGGTY